MTFFVYDPIRKYEYNKGGAAEISTLGCAVKSCSVANNQEVIAAVTGKRIRIMGWTAVGAGISTYTFKSASGGSTILNTMFAPNGNTAGANDLFPIVDSGYFETNTGEGLFVDVTGFATNLNVFYTTYTP